MTDHKTVIARSIRRCRGVRDLSQSQLAALAGLEPSAIAHFEAARRVPSWKNLEKLADALEVTIDELFGREGDRAASPLASRVLGAMSRMQRRDQESLASFAEMLADKPKGKSKSTTRKAASLKATVDRFNEAVV